MSLEILPGVEIADEDLQWSVSRGGGPGGQHVNKVSTRVTLRFDLLGSTSLTDEQKARARRRLDNRLTVAGEIVMHAGRHRSQTRNRDELRERFAELMARALTPPRPRRKTKPSSGARERRLETKRIRSSVKRSRAGGRGGAANAGD